MKTEHERLSKVKHDFMKHDLLVKEIKGIKKELYKLKERQEVIEDSLLSADDTKALEGARRDLKHKKTVSLSDMKRELNL